MKLPNARKFFGRMRNRIYGIFGRKIGTTATPLKQQEKNKPVNGHHRRLPLEMECEIFKCLKLPIQQKFIWGMGRGVYEMFDHQILTKTMRVCNPNRNLWNRATTRAIVSRDGLHASAEYERRMPNIYAEKGFVISGNHSRADSFPGTIIYYYELNLSSYSCCRIGFSDGTPVKGISIGEYPNSYATTTATFLDWCHLAGETHDFELPEGAIQPPEPNDNINSMDVYGCGLLLDPNDKLAIFFTLNGILIGLPIPICPSKDVLFPAVTICIDFPFIEANFGNDKDKPFKYDVKKCPGMGLDCI